MQWGKLLNSDRRRKSTSPKDARIEFERDYDRAVFSNPLKRLQDKAQVFPLDPNDAVRTRLTHSLEVSSVAKGIAREISPWLTKNGHIALEQERSIETIAATCGLIHDLGNPPFGHAGELAIQEWFNDKGRDANDTIFEGLNPHGGPDVRQDFLRFEGNAQTLRLITRLNILADYEGLNLTYGTLSCACKYLASSDGIDKKSHCNSKPGYFHSEKDVIEDIRKSTGTENNRNPITLIVEAADDIVYSVADLEDGVKKGVLSWGQLYKILYSKRATIPIIKEVIDRKNCVLKAGRSSVPRNLPDDRHASAFRTACIGVLVKAAAEAFKGNYDDIMEGRFTSELVSSCDNEYPLIKEMKRIGREYVYSTPETLKLEIMGKKVIGDLMDLFWQGAKDLPNKGPVSTKAFSGKVGALLSENYRQVFQHTSSTRSPLPIQYYKIQLVTDYICGMTDTFARRLHSELFNGSRH